MSHRQTLLPLVAPALLSLVALGQIALTRVEGLTPWKGGGFGMFSTIDSTSARLLRLELRTDQGLVSVALPPAVRQPASELRAMPSQARLEALAHRLAALRWIIAPGGTPDRPRLLGAPATLPLPTGVDVKPAQVTALHLSLWRYDLDAAHLRLEAYKALETTLDLAPLAVATPE